MKSALLTPSVEEINITNERVYTNSYDVKPLVFYRPVEKQQSSH